MSLIKKRNVHPPEFKAKIALEAIRGAKTINEIAHPGSTSRELSA
jgi:transposase-like protein